MKKQVLITGDYEQFAILFDGFQSLLFDLFAGKARSLPVLDDFYDGLTITDETGRICYMNAVQPRSGDLNPAPIINRLVTEV
jgi:hypothetical protein